MTSTDNNANKPRRAILISKTIKVSFLVFALIAAYLFALNGRFIRQDTDEYFDKWTKTILVIDKYKTIEQK